VFDSLYVIHCRALAERRAHCQSLLTDFRWQPRWIEEPEPGRLSAGVWLRRVRTLRLTRAQLSVYLKHERVWREFSRGGRGAAFVLEDDAVFPEAFPATLRRYLERLPRDFDLAFLGASCGLEAALEPGAECFARGPRTRSLSGYLVSRECSRILAEALRRRPIAKPIDLAVDDVIRERSLVVYWSVPALILNGSESGRFPRSLGGGAWRRNALVRRLSRLLLRRAAAS
jgi:hypothetical protein